MNILIKDMDMPKNCYKCWLGHKCPKYEALLWNEIDKERKADCPLVPVPPHGRLIDADALKKDGWKLFKQVRSSIHEMPLNNPSIPTIIEAEDDDD